MLTGMTENRTIAMVRRFMGEFGATIVSIENNRRHATVRFRTKDGIQYWMRVSQGAADPYKIRGWVRQSINRAAGRVEHARQIIERR